MTEKESIQSLLRSVNDLVEDLEINNPTYHLAFHVGENPIIQLIASAFSLNPMWFAKPIYNGKYVEFDLDKIKLIKNDLESRL